MVRSDHGDNQSREMMMMQMGRAQGMMMMPPASNPSRSPAAAATSSSTSASSKAMAHQQQQAAAAAAGPLRCPRCDSSNTKFCYYNNYSLSQPRHFCKACKRYWTRGGTLRNVPVGGGCRKNKRVKKQPSSTAAASATAVTSAQQPTVPPTSADMSSFFYASSDMNLGPMSFDAVGGMGGLTSNANPYLQQPLASSYLDKDYSSLLASTMKHHQSLLPYDGLQQANLGFLKDVKFEGDNNLMASSSNNFSTDWGAHNYPFEAINGGGGPFGDASCMQYWNPAMGSAGGWPDTANPSIAPLI